MVDKKDKVVEKQETTNSVLTVKSLGAIAGIIVTVLSAVAGAFTYVDNTYVSKEVYAIHVTENDEDLRELDEKTAGVITALQTQNQQEFNRVYKAIKDGTALPLIVRRDILLARGQNLSPEERAELTILETKLDELNIQ